MSALKSIMGKFSELFAKHNIITKKPNKIFQSPTCILSPNTQLLFRGG